MFLPAQPLPHPLNTKNVPFMVRSSCSAGPMAFLTQQNTKNATHGRVFHVCVLPPPAQPAEFVPPAATRHLRAPSPPPSSRTPERDHKVAFWCLSAQPSTFYHPGMKNATTELCSSCLGGFPYPRHPFHYPLRPRHEHTTPASRSLCLGCPTTLPTPTTTQTHLWSRSLGLGVSLPFSPPSTTQTRRTRPCGRVLRVWVVFHTPYMNTRPPVSHSSCLGCPTTLPTTHYHPDTKNATTGSRFSFLGCPFTFPSTLYWGVSLYVWVVLTQT